MNTPETINIEKYANALNNLIGVDSAYMAGDKSVDAIVELIVAAKKLENRVKELTEENGKLKAEDNKWRRLVEVLNQNNAELETELAQTYDLLEETKADTVRKIQEFAHEEAWQMGCGWIVDLDSINQIAKEMLEENK